MRVIDVSNWNGWPFNTVTENAFADASGVIVKATEGTGYTNPLCDSQYQYAKKHGKKLGVYHYANGGSASAEARYFYNAIKGYIGEAIPCLDWESGSNSSWGSTSWALNFCTEFHNLSGVWPMIYVQASAVWQVATCSKHCALWIAGYPTNAASWTVPSFPYSTSPWSGYTLWQFSSGGGIDRNISNVGASGWDKLAGKATTYTPKTITKANAYKAIASTPVYTRATISSKKVGTLKEGTIVAFTKLHRTKKGVWYGKIASGDYKGKWAIIKSLNSGKRWLRAGAVIKEWTTLKTPQRRVNVSTLHVYDKPSSHSERLGAYKKGAKLTFDYAKRNYYGNIWGRLAAGKYKGQWVMMKSAEQGWYVSK